MNYREQVLVRYKAHRKEGMCPEETLLDTQYRGIARLGAL